MISRNRLTTGLHGCDAAEVKIKTVNGDEVSSQDFLHLAASGLKPLMGRRSQQLFWRLRLCVVFHGILVF